MRRFPNLSRSADRIGRWRRTFAWCLILIAVLLMAAEKDSVDAPEDVVEAGLAEPRAVAHLIRVPLPLVDVQDTEIMAAADRLLGQLPAAGPRPIFIFEFSATDERAAGSSRFERALALARYLAGDQFRRVRTVAYLPRDVVGHAVLPVLACEEIIMDPDAQLGAAGQEESSVDAMVREAYREIASRRRTIPVPVVLGMLDASLSVSELQLVDGGVLYALADELEQHRQQSEVWKEGTLVREGELGLFTGRQLRLEHGFASHLAGDHRELEAALGLARGSLGSQRVEPDAWRGWQIDVSGQLVTRTADEFVRAIRAAQSGEPANVILVPIDSPGGDPMAALRMVHALADLGSSVRTIAYVGEEARSVAALVALVCDEVFAAEQSQLGGPGIQNLTARELEDIQRVLQDLAESRGVDWSLWQAMVDPSLKVFRHRHGESGQQRFLCEAERQTLPDADKWIREGALETEQGVSGLEAHRLGLVAANLGSFPQVLDRLNLGDQLTVSRPNRAVTAIEQLARQPWFAPTLLFVAFFALITEASAPGIGVAGFLSGLCFLLFFWSQFLNGTAGWLEVVLFLGGLVCIALEIAVIPGFGIFGIGGVLMVLASIVLASQTFVIPRNSYQLDQLPRSLMPVVFAGGGTITGIWLMRRMLRDSPLFQRLMLTPPDEEEMEQLESIVDWCYLEGQKGIAVTQLTPSGKVRIGDEIIDVIADGTVIARGDEVVVVEVRGNRVLVEPTEEGR